MANNLTGWLTIDRLNGKGDSTVTLTASSNNTEEVRKASVRIKTNTKSIILSVSQGFIPTKPEDIPDNQLWAKSKYGTQVTLRSSTNDFAKKIVSTELNADGWTIFTFAEPLTIIEDEAFYINSALEKVIFPKTLTTIGYQAFYNCVNLTSLLMPESLTTIGGWAFMYCNALTDVNLGNVLTIGERAFYKCPALSILNLGNCVTSIGEGAFVSTAITSLVIPDSVTTIGEGAFRSCSLLEVVDFPDSVTEIGHGVFAGSNKLREFNSPSATEDKRCLIIDNKLCGFAWADLETYVLPNGITEIQDYMFATSTLKEITIPDGVTSIGDSTFQNCKSLSKIICKAQVAPLYGSNSFYGIKDGGVLEYPSGSNYSSWLTGGYNLGYHGWTGVPY